MNREEIATNYLNGRHRWTVVPGAILLSLTIIVLMMAVVWLFSACSALP